MSEPHVPGLVILVADHGEPVAVRAYGFADVEHRVPMTVDTRFEIGSLTKAFTAACILQLADAHKLSLDDTVGMYVPSFAAAKAVTIRQLLQQASGIPDVLSSDGSMIDAQQHIATSDLIARIAGAGLQFPPGTKWAYSNSNDVILGSIIESVTHETWEQYVREHIFVPAHLTHTGFIGEPAVAGTNARGYIVHDGKPEPAPQLDESWAYAAGAIVSTAGDLLAFDNALLSGSIVPEADVQLMRTRAFLANGTPTGYGLGWAIDGPSAHPRIWHNGETFGFTAANLTYPKEGETIIVLTNLAYIVPQNIGTHVYKALHPELVPTAAAGEDPAVTARAREWYGRFRTGNIDRSQLGNQMLAPVNPDMLATFKLGIAPVGDLERLIFIGSSPTAGDMTVYAYYGEFTGQDMRVFIILDSQRKIQGYAVRPLP